MAEEVNKTLAGIVSATQTVSEPFPGLLKPASEAGSSSVLPAGVVVDWGGSTAPTGWLLCDGSAVSRSVYADLFANISTAYGAGDGSTTFNLPDTQGRVSVGLGTHADVSTLGNSDGVTTSSRRPKHQHTVTESAHAHSIPSVDTFNHTPSSGSSGSAGGDRNLVNLTATGSATTGLTVGVTTSPTDTPAYLVFNKIIKT